jgi:iron complex outermembrane recepter protein
MNVNRSHRSPIARIVSAVLASAAGLAPMMSHAADEPTTNTSGLEEVLVTATRAANETNLQQTPISVSAVTASDINRMVAKDLSGIASSVPGFSASRITAFNAASFAMRGVGLTDIIVYQDSPVGVQVDDFVMPSVQTQLLDTFDMKSVEVLRGPQGTLFGKNTTGGAVNITTKRPNMQNFESDVRLGYGSFNEKRIQGSVDLPIIDNVLSMRVVGSDVTSDGYYKLGATYGPINTFSAFTDGHAFTIPGITGQTGNGQPGKSAGGEDVANGRVKVEWHPTDAIKVLAQYEIMRDRSDSVPAYNDTPPGGPYLWNFLGFTRPSGDPLNHVGATLRNDSLLKMGRGQVIDVDGYYLNAEWDVGVGTIYAQAGKRDQDEHLPNTYTGAAPVNSVTGQVLSLFDATRDTTRQTTQYEVRFASKLDGPVNFVAGAFQQTNDAAFCVVQVLGFIDLAFDLQGTFGPGVPQQLNNNSPQVLCNKQKSDSLAGYVDATWDVTDKFSLSGGYRETRDERSWAGRTQVGFDLLDDNLNNGSLSWQDFNNPLQAGNFKKYPGGIIVNDKTPGFGNLSETWQEPSWRIVGSYKFTDNIFSYLTVSRGYKAGGYNDQTGTSGLMVSALTRPVNPEFATNYELGLKFENDDHTIRVNPTIFYTKYEDAQRAVNIISTKPGGATFQETVFYNAASVEAKGAELEFQALITDPFRIRVTASYLDATYQDFQIHQPEVTDPVTGATIQAFDGDFTGLPVPRSPKYMGSIQGIYTLDLANGANLEFTGEVYHEDRNLFYISAAGRQYDAYLDEKNLLNAAVTYKGVDDKYFIRAYGKNLSDERYRIASQSVATLWTHSQFGAPRNFGIEVGVHFGK